MKFSWLKRTLSYLVPIRLEKLRGIHNPHLEVHLHKGRIQLSTAHAIYSHEDLYSNYTLSFEAMKKHLDSIEDVLILGLGLGSIPNMLERKFGKRYQYTAVEIDETVISLAHQYNLKFLESPVTCICADASLFVQQCQQKFDLICIDLFIDDEIPSDFRTDEFLKTIQQLLNPKGWIMYNALGAKPSDIKKSMDYFESVFKSEFPEAIYLEVDRNYMFLNRAID